MTSSAHIPASYAEPIVPDVDLSSPSRGIYVSGGGDISAVMTGDKATVVFLAVPAGSVIPIRCDRVTAANTTATDMVALW